MPLIDVSLYLVKTLIYKKDVLHEKKYIKYLILTLVAAVGIITYTQYESTSASSVKNAVLRLKYHLLSLLNLIIT